MLVELERGDELARERLHLAANGVDRAGVLIRSDPFRDGGRLQ